MTSLCVSHLSHLLRVNIRFAIVIVSTLNARYSPITARTAPAHAVPTHASHHPAPHHPIPQCSIALCRAAPALDEHPTPAVEPIF